MDYQQTIDYLDSLPSTLALFWVMENVNEEHPQRQQFFFYCRERARQVQQNFKQEQKFDAILYKRMNAPSMRGTKILDLNNLAINTKDAVASSV